MGKILVTDREIVLPGQVLAEGMDFLPASGEVIREGENLISTKIGLVSVNNRFVKVIPLTGSYVPKINDLIIGKVTSITPNGWRVDYGATAEAFIPLREGSSDYIPRADDMPRYYKSGDYIVAQIINVSFGRLVDLSMKGPGLRKLSPGRILNVPSCKVPRIIGKQGSMISMIKESTGCKISVGQNGLIWLTGEDLVKELKAIGAIELIVKESHVSGLTDLVKAYLEK